MEKKLFSKIKNSSRDERMKSNMSLNFINDCFTKSAEK